MATPENTLRRQHLDDGSKDLLVIRRITSSSRKRSRTTTPAWYPLALLLMCSAFGLAWNAYVTRAMLIMATTNVFCILDATTTTAMAAESSLNIPQHKVPPSMTVTIPRMIFYNIYVNPIHPEKALEIAHEQLRMMPPRRNSLQNNNVFDPDPIRFVLIGDANASSKIEDACAPNCEQIQYLPKGDEGNTLQALWDFCQDHSTSMVTYIHNKGSFHPSEENDKFRTMLTRAAMSEECQSLGNECDMCGARFAVMPHYHMAGNMWTAKCSYVRKLIPPQEFPQRMEAMITHALMHHDDDMPKPQVKNLRPGHAIGVGRFAFEHWLGSHPDLKPCDVYPKANYRCGYKGLPAVNDRWKPRLQQAPWIPLKDVGWRRASGEQEEWNCGRGILFQMEHLYHTLPPHESFIWAYYANHSRTCSFPLSSSPTRAARNMVRNSTAW